MNAQEVFDIAVKGVIEQGRKSVNKQGDCLYRGPNGIKCAVGFLLEDEEAFLFDNLENGKGNDVAGLHKAGLLPDELNEHWEMLDSLQLSHDCADHDIHFVESFKSNAAKVAHEFNLVMPV